MYHNVLSDSVNVAIRQKDKSCYFELATETDRYFISSDVWLKTDWVSELDHSLDTRVFVGYRKCVGFISSYRTFSTSSFFVFVICLVTFLSFFFITDPTRFLNHLIRSMVLITFSVLGGTCDPPTWSVCCGSVGCGALCTYLCIVSSLPVAISWKCLVHTSIISLICT